MSVSHLPRNRKPTRLPRARVPWQDTKYLRSVLPSLEPGVKERMLQELKQKVELIKRNKSQIRELEREITGYSIPLSIWLSASSSARLL